MSFLNYHILNLLGNYSQKSPAEQESFAEPEPNLADNSIESLLSEEESTVLQQNLDEDYFTVSWEGDNPSAKESEEVDKSDYVPLFERKQLTGSRYEFFEVNKRIYQAIDNGEETQFFRIDGIRDIIYEIIGGLLCVPKERVKNFVVKDSDRQALTDSAEEKGLSQPLIFYSSNPQE